MPEVKSVTSQLSNQLSFHRAFVNACWNPVIYASLPGSLCATLWTQKFKHVDIQCSHTRWIRWEKCCFPCAHARSIYGIMAVPCVHERWITQLNRELRMQVSDTSKSASLWSDYYHGTLSLYDLWSVFGRAVNGYPGNKLHGYSRPSGSFCCSLHGFLVDKSRQYFCCSNLMQIVP